MYLYGLLLIACVVQLYGHIKILPCAATFSETRIVHCAISWSAIYFFLSRSFSSPLCFFCSLHDKLIIPILFPTVVILTPVPALSSRVFVSVALAVCQMYPGLQISHVEEASSPATIPGWCKKGWGHCQTRSFIVVPYRCLGESKIHPEQFIIQISLQKYNADQISTAISYVVQSVM